MANKKSQTYAQRQKRLSETAKKNFAAYQKQFIKETYRGYSIKFSKAKDKAIIDKLASVPNQTDYIRKLILKDLAETSGTEE